jgi:hypothetical protein
MSGAAFARTAVTQFYLAHHSIYGTGQIPVKQGSMTQNAPRYLMDKQAWRLSVAPMMDRC